MKYTPIQKTSLLKIKMTDTKILEKVPDELSEYLEKDANL